jgi:hypothetical protein
MSGDQFNAKTSISLSRLIVDTKRLENGVREPQINRRKAKVEGWV